MRRLIILPFIMFVFPLKSIGQPQWKDFYIYDENYIYYKAGAGSALTYGKHPNEEWGKLFILTGDEENGCYHFLWTYAHPDPYNHLYVKVEPLPAPNPGILPQPDGAISYFYDATTGEEKVVAVFGGGLDVWCYDVPSRTWRKEGKLPGTTPMAEGGSMEFWGLRRLNGFRVASFFLIKGGLYPSGYEFWRYNRGPMQQPPRSAAPYPEWEQLKPFKYPSSDLFGPGADIAIYHWDPYIEPLADTVFAMRGWGTPFGLYRISLDHWIFPYNYPTAGDIGLGGALVSHPKWSPDSPDSTDESKSILHCFEGGDNDFEFDCFHVEPGSDVWSRDPENPVHPVSSGSDLVYGDYWDTPESEPIDGIWGLFGNDQYYIGFYPRQTEVTEGYGGSQLFSSFNIKDKDVIVTPNPVKEKALFSLTHLKSHADIIIYSECGEIIRSLKFQTGNCFWDLKDINGKNVPAGIYFYTINTENRKIRGKLVVNK